MIDFHLQPGGSLALVNERPYIIVSGSSSGPFHNIYKNDRILRNDDEWMGSVCIAIATN